MSTYPFPPAQPLSASPAWKALQAHHQVIGNTPLRQLFADDPQRGDRLAAEGAGLYLDYAKNRITDQTLDLLEKLAEQCGLNEHIEAMFEGKKINVTERR